jgi:hypothetical protein
VVTNTLKIMGATMLLLATSNDGGVNVRLVGYGLSVSRYQGIYYKEFGDVGLDGELLARGRVDFPISVQHDLEVR